MASQTRDTIAVVSGEALQTFQTIVSPSRDKRNFALLRIKPRSSQEIRNSGMQRILHESLVTFSFRSSVKSTAVRKESFVERQGEKTSEKKMKKRHVEAKKERTAAMKT